MRRVLILFFLMVQMLPGATTRDVLGRYMENIKKIKSIKAKLHIEIKRGDTYNYTKVDYINKGNMMYMKAPSPMYFILVSDGKKGQFYSRRDNTVYIYQPGEYAEVYDDPMKEKKEVLKDVPELKKIGKKYLGWKELDVYEGKPVATDQFISKFRVWVDDRSGLLYRLESYDLHGQLISRMDMKKYREFDGIWFNLETRNWTKTDTEIIESATRFKDIEVNGKIDDSIFDFEVPEGAKVKDLTQMILDQKKKK